MTKAMVMLLPLFALVGCQIHSAQYSALDVGVANNQPCFIVPTTSLSGALTATAPTITRLNGSQWQVLTPGATWQPTRTIIAGDCTGWTEINRQPGVYDIAFKVSTKDRATRYAARFVVQKNGDGKIAVHQQE